MDEDKNIIKQTFPKELPENLITEGGTVPIDSIEETPPTPLIQEIADIISIDTMEEPEPQVSDTTDN